MKFADEFVHSYEKEIIDTNKKFWHNENNSKAKEYIAVFHELPQEFELCLLENVAAKGLQMKNGMPIISFQNFTSRRACLELDNSFGIPMVELKTPDEKRYTELTEKIVTETFPKKEAVFSLEYRGITCGEAIYDQIMRNQCGKSFDWDSIDRNTYFEYVKLALMNIDAAYLLFEEYKPKYIVTMEWIYVKGLVVMVAQAIGATMIHVDIDYPEIFVSVAPCRRLVTDIKWNDLLKVYIENSERGKEEKDDMFMLKTNQFSEDWVCKNGKKNVFIMLHALGDIPRTCSHLYIYDDYADWYEDTMKHIRQQKNINWYIKDHPQALWYGQDRYVKKIFEKYRSDNIFWCDKNVSGMKIKEVADCIITSSGDVGIEYWSYGIPTITLAGTHYTDWGISYNIRTRDEYYNILGQMEDIKAPTKEQINVAKKYMNAYASLNDTEDPFARLIIEERKRQLEQFAKGDVSANSIHYDFARRYVELLRNFDIRNSSCFNLDMLYEVN